MSHITSKLLAVLLALGIAQADAQTSTGSFPVGVTGSGVPGGASGQLQYNSGGTFGGVTLGGDATLDTSTGALTVTKTNGVPFAPSATTDTTNAANISSGMLPAARLPNPSASALGGTESIAPVSHQWIDSISTAGVPHLSQPSASDIAGLGTAATVNTGTSGSLIPLLSTANTWTLAQTFSAAPVLASITGSTQCLHVNVAGVISGTGTDCGAASGGSGTVTGGSNEGAGVGVYDSTNSTSTTLKFKTLVAGSNITLTDNGANGVTIAASGSGGSATIVQPQGRLTLTSGQPVMQSDVTGASTIYYTAQSGDQYPWYNGTAWAMQAFSSDLSVTLDATNTASDSLYDIFGYVSSGTPVACYGPAWTNSTTRSASITRLSGIWVNAASMTCRASSSTAYTVPADQGTYLGTFYATAAGQTGVSCKPAAVSGGANNVVGLWNAYNRVPVSCIDLQSASYTNATQTWGPAGTYATFRITLVDGLGESPTDCVYKTNVETSASSRYPWVGCARNSTTAAPGDFSTASPGTNEPLDVISQEPFAATLGLNYYQAMQSGTNVTGSTVSWNVGGVTESLMVRTAW